MFDVINDVAQELAMRLRSALGEEIRLREWRAETPSQPAWQLVQRAKELEKLMSGYRRAGAREPVRKLAVRADSMLAAASDLDPKWAEPLVQRGRVMHRAAWACFATNCGDTVVLGILSQAEKWSTAAVGRPNAEADALAVRGAVRYSRWSMALDKPPAYGLLRAAEADLGRAVELDPDLAGAWNGLSAVLFAEGRFEEASMAASRAFEKDAFLSDQGAILTRLFNSAFHSGRDTEAAQWCREIGFRLKNLWPAAECSLDLLGWSEIPRSSSVRTAWSTLRSAGNADAPMIRDRMRVRLQALVAVVIARSGMPDSAKAVLDDAMRSASGDDDFAPFGAAALAALGDSAGARRVLADYVGRMPGPRQSVLRYRWFNGISDSVAAMMYSWWPD
jgi:tetratricopeptide (TPR) repeat protein